MRLELHRFVTGPMVCIGVLGLLGLNACQDAPAGPTASDRVNDIATDSVTLDLGGADSAEGDAASDVTVVPDGTADGAGSTPDTADTKPSDAPCGEAGCSCSDNTDCNSGLCIDVDDHKECAALCSGNGCQSGFKCALLTGPSGDITNLCVPKAPRICEPCGVDSDCNTALGGAESRCVPYKDGAGILLGAFCGVSCASAGDCPGGYACQEKQSTSGVTSKQCVKTDQVCECDGRAKKLKLGTTCANSNDVGSCSGKRYCGAAGLSGCDAPAAVTELCNQVDDNCNGKTDEPTAGVCDDANVCTYDNCFAGECQHPTKGGECEDGDVCTTGDSCSGLKCVGSAISCDDKNPCTIDTCDKAKGCTASPDDGAACTDNSACTVGDNCQGSACLPGVATVCDDQNPCTTDSCEAKTGCVFASNQLACSDGNACTVGDACQGSACLPGVATVCDDQNPCTTDSCDKKTGCVFASNQLACSDGNACTVGDACQGSVCSPGAAVDCNDGKLCTTDTCDASAGCAHSNNTLPCDDANVCTLGDTCTAGACKSGAAITCDDGNPCTDSSCDKLKGCTHTGNTAPCNDNNSCTIGDTCKASVCTPSGPSDCDDKNPCTTETCNAMTGCQSANNTAPCSDGSACTLSDTCAAGVCKPGSSISCDDGNPCTDDSCAAKTGCGHVANAAPCNDSDNCTVGDACKAGLCLPGVATSCDDGNACTDNSCKPTSGCSSVNNSASCSDGNACTVAEACKSGACVGGALNSCDDANGCTTDSCDAATGLCSHTSIPGCWVLLYQDEFDASTLNSFWKPQGTSVVQADGLLKIQENATDTYAQTAASLPNVANLRIEMKHYMHAANDYFMPGVLVSAKGTPSGFALVWKRSSYPPDYCGQANGYDKVLVQSSAGCAVSSLKSSSYYDKWVISCLEYRKSDGLVSYDSGCDGQVDFTATLAVADRVAMNYLVLSGYGWWTGHYHNLDWIKIYVK